MELKNGSELTIRKAEKDDANEIIRFAKQTKKLEILHLGVKSDNTQAIGLYKKLGFQEIGRYPKFFKINGHYYDEILMNLYIMEQQSRRMWTDIYKNGRRFQNIYEWDVER